MPKRKNSYPETVNQQSDENAIVKRLNIIIHLLLNQAEPKGADETARAEIKMLKDLGLTNVEIAAILGKTESYISSALSKLKKKKKKKAKKGTTSS